MRVGKFDSAARAAQRLLDLKGPSAKRFAGLAEALLFAGRARPPPRFCSRQGPATLTPKAARARFYSGLAAEQDGNKDKALEIRRQLEFELAEGAEKRAVSAQIARLSSAPPATAADAIRNMPRDQQQQSICGMVDGLELRLKASGGTSDEWQRLLRARPCWVKAARRRGIEAGTHGAFG